MEHNAGDVARRWFAEVWNARNDGAIDELLAENVRGVHPAGEYHGRAGFREVQRMFLAGMPDVRIEVEEVIADGDRVAVRWRATGTHTGDGLGFPASHRPFSFLGTSWMRVQNGQTVQGWDTWDLTGLMALLRA